MSGRLAILGGLLAGLVTAAVAFAMVVVFTPEPVASPTPAPSLVTSPSPAATGSASASGSPGASGSAGPSGSAIPVPTSSLAGLFHIGQPAPELNVPQLGGGVVNLANLKGKPIWLNFMATWCPPCRDELPLMNGFAARYGANGLVIVAVDVREDSATVAPFMDSLQVAFPVGLDENGTAQQAWGAAALPVHYWIDAQGIVREGAFGGIGPDIMATSLQKILPGVSVTP